MSFPTRFCFGMAFESHDGPQTELSLAARNQQTIRSGCYRNDVSELHPMKTKEQIKKEADERRRRHEKEQLHIQRDIISGIRHPGGLLKTETERWNDLHPDDLR